MAIMDSQNKIAKLIRMKQLSENERSITLKNWQSAKETTEKNDTQLLQLKNYLQNYASKQEESMPAGFYHNHQNILGRIREGITQQEVKLQDAKKVEFERWEKYIEANKKKKE